ncbi:hypothetical protein TKK_0018217 [Trichogramma kaykai]
MVGWIEKSAQEKASQLCKEGGNLAAMFSAECPAIVQTRFARPADRERMALAPEELALYWTLVKVGDFTFYLFVVVRKLLLLPHVLVDVWAPLRDSPLPEVGDLRVLSELEIECMEIGLFFKVNAKTEKELCPLIKKYIHHDTSRTCIDSARQYEGVEKMFSSNTMHLRTNHSIAEYIDKIITQNTINNLENQNKLLKKSIMCCRSSELLHQYMSLYFYRKAYLKQYQNDLGSQIMKFLDDIKILYPGIVDGEMKED